MIEQAENEILKVIAIIGVLGVLEVTFILAWFGSKITEQLKRIADKPARTYVANCPTKDGFERLTDDVASNNDRFK